MPSGFECAACGKKIEAVDDDGGAKRCPHCTSVIDEPVYDAEVQPESVRVARGIDDSANQKERQPCPMCGELIVSTAVKCRFCGEVFAKDLKRRGRVGQFAPCPRCSSTCAQKVSFTWWGGALGPWLLNHVKCRYCGATYNGKTGKSNAAAIAIYTLAGLVITLFAFFAIILSK